MGISSDCFLLLNPFVFSPRFPVASQWKSAWPRASSFRFDKMCGVSDSKREGGNSALSHCDFE